MRKIPLLCMLAVLSVVITAGSALTAADAAEYTGGDKCKECHAGVVKTFATNIHAKASAYGIKEAGCESCHGPAGNHVTSGDKAAIFNPAKGTAEAASAQCLGCHGKGKRQMYWHGSIHEAHTSCVTCHKVHRGNDRLLAARSEVELCGTCHVDVRGDLFKRSKHPMRDSSTLSGEGKMSCSSCHNPHGAPTHALVDARSFNDKCYECHAEKRAPLLWEHSPVKEDCLTCHTPHGSSNDKMLVTKVPRLCQQCHAQGRHQSAPFPTNSVFLFNRSCLNCHPMIHGSNHPSGPVLQR